MRKIVAFAALSLGVAQAFASDARIATMGGTAHFMKDPTSVFLNPATVSQYGNYLYGDMGTYVHDTSRAVNEALSFENRDPLNPYFGGNIAFTQREDGSGFFLGGAFNRRDPLLELLCPSSESFIGVPVAYKAEEAHYRANSNIPGKIDLIAAYRMPNGLTLGAGAYLAVQNYRGNVIDKFDENDRNIGPDTHVKERMTRIAKGTFGISGEVSPGFDLEASVGIAALTLDFYHESQPEKISTFDNDIALTFDARVFADMGGLRQLVPHIQANIINYEGGNDRMIDFNAGVGINALIDRGFFWAGLEGVYRNNPRYYMGRDSRGIHHFEKMNTYGGRVALGIERNMLTDWLIFRAGATHELLKEAIDDGNRGETLKENDNDTKIAFGIGINFEDRLFVDAVIAEDFLNTFGNIFSGNLKYIVPQISVGFYF